MGFRRLIATLILLVPTLAFGQDHNVPFRPQAAAAGAAWGWVQGDAASEYASGDCGDASCNVTVDDTTSWTVEYAFKGLSATPVDETRVGFEVRRTAANSKIYMAHRYSGTDKNRIQGNSGGETQTVTDYDANVLNAEDWFRISWVHDVTATTCYLYVDGVEQWSSNPCGIVNGNQDDDIVYVAGGPDFFADAKISDVRVWNEARGATDILNQHDCQIDCVDGGSCPTELVAYWPINEGSGSSIDDVVDAGDDEIGATLTISGLTWDSDTDEPFGGWVNDGANGCQ